jgi:threonyl-tRNA synthetase
MRILCIHADKFSYETKERTKFAEEIPDAKKKAEVKEALVVFTSVEKDDSADLKAVAANAAASIDELIGKLGTKTVMLYPYAHLSSELASPKDALQCLVLIEEALKSKGLAVTRSPFGWYKAFELVCKGHPLSELSREIHIQADESKTREDVVAGIESKYLILTPDGEEFAFDPSDPKSLAILDKFPAIKTYVIAEELKGGTNKEPPSIKAMQRLELVDYEEASDSGHFRFYPKGTLIFNLLRDWVRMIAIDRLKCVQIETPILYDWARPDIRGQTLSFHERHYTVDTPEKKKFVLRFAGDFGLFRMFSDATLSYRHLPIKVYEFSKSFRFEQRGELTGLKRVRGFHMPDIHSFAKDIQEGWEEFGDIYRAYTDFSDGTGIDYMIAFRIEKAFYDQYKQELVRLLKYSKKPALINTLSQRKHYWAVKLEFNGLDSVGGACQLSTDQLDVEDAERYGITYAAEDGTKKGCIIAHSSIGSIERWIYQILEHALKKEKPVLPLWLTPTQVRIIPVSDDFVEDCENLVEKIKGRVDVDDRDMSLGKKIREAEREWINLIAVYGEKESKSGNLALRVRTGGKELEQKDMSLEALNSYIADNTKGYPYRGLALPVKLSKRPIFRGG